MKLTVVGLPLGNIEDISIRQLKALFEADIILAEDTRNVFKIKSILKERFDSIITSLQLDLNREQKIFSYRDQNHDRSLPEILRFIQEGKNIILVSDAGMPAISDPGFKLIRDLHANKVEVDVIPSATAVDTALVISGLPTDSFIFLGFLPRENGKIKKQIKAALESPASSILYYESPFRVLKSLEVIAEENSELNIAAINDLTKKFQKVIKGNIQEVITELKKSKVVGEWVIVISKK